MMMMRATTTMGIRIRRTEKTKIRRSMAPCASRLFLYRRWTERDLRHGKPFHP
jgi:hypothetical protein